MEIFVTGGTSFIGSYVVHALISQGHHVTILARNVQKIKGFLGRQDIALVHGTLSDRDVIERAMRGKDACIHIALGLKHTPVGRNTAVEMLEGDTLPAGFIFETAATLGVKHLIYTSSIAAFGEQRDVFAETTCSRPTNFYDAAKAASEAYLLAVSQVYNVRGNVIRPGFTFGNPVVEGAPIYSDKRFETIIRSAQRNEPILLPKDDGTEFIWAGDLASVYTAVLASDQNRQLFTAVSTEFTTWEEIARMVIACVGSRSEIVLEGPAKDNTKGRHDVSLIDRVFGFKFVSAARLQEHVAYLADHMF